MIAYNYGLHEKLISGELKAIGWGISSDLLLQIKRAPYQFDCIIDGLSIGDDARELFGVPVFSPAILQKLSVKDYGIVIFADPIQFGKEILASIRQFGDFSVSTPFNIWSHKCTHQMSRELLGWLASGHSIQRSPRPNSVTLLIHGLVKGGAEKQICLLAMGFRSLDFDVTLITYNDDAQNCDSLARLLTSAGVNRVRVPSVRHITQSNPQYALHERDEIIAKSLSGRAFYICDWLLNYFQKNPSSLAVSFLDDANMLLGLSALKVGIPKIVLCGRNLAPIEFPKLGLLSIPVSASYHIYKLILAHQNVKFLNNSMSGARSYANWLLLDSSSIGIIPNAVFDSDDPYQDTRATRAQFGIADNELMVIGVMRLSEEKRPSLFIDVIYELTKKMTLKALLFGAGLLEHSIAQQIEKLGLRNQVILAGTSDQIPSVMKAADLLIHTSREEGMPNVLMEAIQHRLPFIATQCQGTSETIPLSFHSLCISKTDHPQRIAEMALSLVGESNIMKFTEICEKSRGFLTPSEVAGLILNNCST